MQDHLWESCGSVVSLDDLCQSLICLHRLSGSSVFSSGRKDLRCRRLMLVSCHLCDVITWWEQKLSALKIVVLSDSSSCEQLSEFERGPIIGTKEAGSANRRIARHIDRRRRPLEDTCKNGWRMADFSVMMVAVDLGPRQIGKTD
ncbi:uncharacterized protein TNCV_4990031 [Trichonephila clavipes]|uniref:Uncharacterized protein n=1 Tax=Trichonephila clavipes TaxID=2585209 RepID=A0A8X7BI99_TRICX|nr:uncharacterized protein TNCV_4990031 [Trichonephila clavipes]